MSRGSKIHELRVSMGEPDGQLIFLHNISHLRRRFIMLFHKTNKMKLSSWRIHSTVFGQRSGGVGLRVMVWGFRASFGNRRARPRNVGSMKWYFLKQKKSKFRNRVNLENSWTLRWATPFFEKNIRFPSLDFLSQLNTFDWCENGRDIKLRLWLLDRLGHKWLNLSISPW